MLEATEHPSCLPLEGVRETSLFSWPHTEAGQILGVQACFYRSVVCGPTPISAYVDSFLSF